MVATIKAVSLRIKKRDMARTTGVTVELTMASGTLESNTVKALSSKLMVAESKESGRTVSVSPGLNESFRASEC